MKQKNKTLGILTMAAAAMCFSLGGLLIKMIPWNPLAINGIRNLIACCIIGGFIKCTHHRIKFNLTVLGGAVCVFGVTTLFTIANKLTTAGNAIVLQYTGPVWIVLFMYLLFRKKPGRTQIITILIVLAGILCFFYDSLSSGKWLGDLCALLSGAFYAVVFMLNEFENGDSLSSIFFGQLMAGVLLSPIAAFETVFTPSAILAIVLLGTIQVGLGYIFISIGTRHTSPVTASLIAALEPIFNPILVALFYGEVLTPLSIIGAVIVICGVSYYSVRQA